MEPAGAAGLAAVLAAKTPVAGRTVALVCSGGNVEPEVFARAIRGSAPTTPHFGSAEPAPPSL